MVLRQRSAALFAALLAIAPACKQSLFDEDVDDDPDEADGGAPETCPEPCAGDAVGHFNGSQGGTSGRWFYVEGGRTPTGLTHDDMTSGMWHTMTAFVGQDTSTAVLPCSDDNDGAQECAGLADTILLSPSETGGTNGTYPALTWRAPSTGAFRLSGDWAGPETYPEGIQHRLLLYRNGRNDLLLTQTFATSHSTAAFDLPIEAYQGDDIRLAILANGAMSVPVGVNFFVTDLSSPGECGLLMTFDDAGDLTDHCNGAMYINTNDPANGEPPTTAGAAPPGMPRMARMFTEGSHLRPAGPAMDYSGDWTIQFWANLASGQWTGETLFSDWGCAEQGGVNITRDYSSDIYVSLFYQDAAIDMCMVGSQYAVVSPPPPDDEWHFYRVSRSTADGVVRICLDGALRGQIPLGGNLSMSSGIAPWLGRNVDYEPAYFRGGLADVRVYTRALPCPTLP